MIKAHLINTFFPWDGLGPLREFKSLPVAGPWNGFLHLPPQKNEVFSLDKGWLNVLPIFWDYFGFKQWALCPLHWLKQFLSKNLSLVSFVRKEEGRKKAKICVTSFMKDPSLLLLKREPQMQPKKERNLYLPQFLLP